MRSARRAGLALLLLTILSSTKGWADSPITSPSSGAVDVLKFKIPGGDVQAAIGDAYDGRDFGAADARAIGKQLASYIGSPKASAAGVFDAIQTMDSVLMGVSDARQRAAVERSFKRELTKLANTGDGMGKAGLAMHKVFRSIRYGRGKTVSQVDKSPEFKFLASSFKASGDAGGDVVMGILHFARNEFSGRATARQRALVTYHLTEGMGKLLAQNINGNRGAGKYTTQLAQSTLEYATFYPKYQGAADLLSVWKDGSLSNRQKINRASSVNQSARATLEIAGAGSWKAPSKARPVFAAGNVKPSRTPARRSRTRTASRRTTGRSGR